VENFFVRRAAGDGPIQRIIATRISVADIPRAIVLRLPER
jgi:hypothetical protein